MSTRYMYVNAAINKGKMAQLNIKLYAYINRHRDPQSRMGIRIFGHSVFNLKVNSKHGFISKLSNKPRMQVKGIDDRFFTLKISSKEHNHCLLC